MKTLLLSFSMLALGFGADAQSYSVTWSTADGGGGTSVGGIYALSGTIGQPDVHHMSGGGVTLTGGFWTSTAALPAPEPPRLTIVPGVRERATVSWSPPTVGFRLQTKGPREPVWIDAPSGATNPVVIPTEEAVRFYRLRKP